MQPYKFKCSECGQITIDFAEDTKKWKNCKIKNADDYWDFDDQRKYPIFHVLSGGEPIAKYTYDKTDTIIYVTRCDRCLGICFLIEDNH